MSHVSHKNHSRHTWPLESSTRYGRCEYGSKEQWSVNIFDPLLFQDELNRQKPLPPLPDDKVQNGEREFCFARIFVFFIFVGFCSHVFWTRCPPAGGTGTSSYALQTQPSSLAGKRHQCRFVDIHTIFSAPCIVSVKVGHRFPCLAIFGVISSRPRFQARSK